MAIKYKYKRTNTRGKIQYYRNIHELSKSLHLAHGETPRLLENKERFNNYTLEELNPPFVFEMPKPNDSITINGVNCTVINVYELTFSVLTDKGTRLVSVKDMSFVEENPDEYVRQHKLSSKNY